MTFMTLGPDSDCQPPEIEKATFSGGLFAAACLRSFPGLLRGLNNYLALILPSNFDVPVSC